MTPAAGAGTAAGTTHRQIGPARPRTRYWAFVQTTVRTFFRVMFGLEIYGGENVPKAGGCLVASNHVSFYDPPVVGSAVPREAWFMGKAELFKIPVLSTVIRVHHAIPIRRGTTDRVGMARAIALVASGRTLVIFPEGGRSVPGVLRPPKGGVAVISLEAGGAPIVPAYVSGTHTARRAMLRRPPVRVTFGPPIWPLDIPEVAELAGRERMRALARIVMDRIAAVRDGAAVAPTQ